jgi:glycosyltransferase involved in cell wall biosynthesis
MRGRYVPIVVSERSDPAQQSLGRLWDWGRRRTYPHASHIAVLTETAKDFFQPWCHVPITVIPSAVQPPPIQSDRSVAAISRHIVAIGRLSYEKGFDRLLTSFAQATQSHPDWSMSIYGEGAERARLVSQAAELGLALRVQFPGWVQPIWEELAHATMFVLPSRYEGFPSALLEAMAMGVPSLAVDCESGPRTIVQHDRNGMLVPNTNEGLTAGIQQMIEDPLHREQLGIVGRRVTQDFSVQGMVDAYEKILQNLAGC